MTTTEGLLPARMFLTPEEAEEARDAAWDRYLRTPHANPLVGRERYRSEIDTINNLERQHG